MTHETTHHVVREGDAMLCRRDGRLIRVTVLDTYQVAITEDRPMGGRWVACEMGDGEQIGVSYEQLRPIPHAGDEGKKGWCFVWERCDICGRET